MIGIRQGSFDGHPKSGNPEYSLQHYVPVMVAENDRRMTQPMRFLPSDKHGTPRLEAAAYDPKSSLCEPSRAKRSVSASGLR